MESSKRGAGRPPVNPKLKRVGKSITLHPYIIDAYNRYCFECPEGVGPSLSAYLERLAALDLGVQELPNE